MPTCLSVQETKNTYGRSEGTVTGSRTYLVKFAETDHDSKDAEVANDGTTAIPAIGALWRTADAAKVIGRTATKTDSDQHHYEVTVNYSSKSQDQDKAIENPLSRPTRFSYGDAAATEPYFRDTDDLPVVNSAGEDFADLPQRERSGGTIAITRNVATFDDAVAQSKRDLINTSSVSINGVSYAARTLRIVGWTADGPNIENDVTFWTETITVAKNSATWDHFLEDRGRNQKISDKLVPILDAKNEPVQYPYPLNGSGVKQSSPTTAPAVITRKPYAAGSFPSLA